MTPPRCYTTVQVLELLQMKRSTFEGLRRQHKLPFVEELLPRAGHPRYRADLLDKWLAGEWGQPRSFASHRRSA